MPNGRRSAVLVVFATVLLTVAVVAVVWWFAGLIPEGPWARHVNNAGNLLGLILACFSVGAAATGLLFKSRVRAWLRRFLGQHAARTGALVEMADQVEAIVVPVSHLQQPSWIVHHLRPKYVALLFSEGSREVAFQLERDLGGLTSFEPSVAKLEEGGHRLLDPNDLAECKSRTEWLIRRFRDELRIPSSRIFVDTTGGTKPMSLGAFQAAEEAHVSSIYVQGRVIPEHGRPVPIIEDPTRREDADPRFMSDWTSSSERA